MNTLFQISVTARGCSQEIPDPTLVMALTLALAIGANTAIFSVVYGVLLRPLPYPQPNQIVSVLEVAPDGHPMNFADPNFDHLHASNHTLIGMAEYESSTDTVVAGTEAATVGSAAVSRDFFRVIGVAPALGRKFGPEEQHPGATPVALVGYGYWRQHLGSSADLASFKLKIENKVYSVVEVLARGFNFPDDTEVWVPRELFRAPREPHGAQLGSGGEAARQCDAGSRPLRSILNR
jgi:hypothetical protein